MTSPIGFLARVTCNSCGATAMTDQPSGFGAAVRCACCPEDHDHDVAANSCPWQGHAHVDADCPHQVGECPHWASVQAGHTGNHPLAHPGTGRIAAVRLYTQDQPIPDGHTLVTEMACPGGHCGPGVDGCTVCRPVTVTVLSLGGTLTPAG